MSLADPRLGPRARLLVRLRDPQFMRLGLTVGAGWGGRIVTAAAQFYAIRLLSVMLGVDGYGAYAVMTGLAGWFALADFGFGSSLQNLISERRVAGQAAADAVGTAAAILLRTTLALFVVVTLVGIWAGPYLLHAFPSISKWGSSAAFIVYAIIAVGTGAASLASRVLFAEHRGYLAHAITAGAALAGLALLALVRQFHFDQPLIWALFAYNLPGWAIPAAVLVRRAIRDHEVRRILLGKRDPDLSRLMWRQARMFLLFNALAALVLNVDYVILSQTSVPRTIAIYAVFAKVYALVFFVFNSVLQAYWPLSAEAIQRGDFSHLRGLTTRAVGLGWCVVLGASAIFYVFLEPFGRILTPSDPLSLPAPLIAYFTLYWCIRVWSDTFGMIIMSAGRPLFLCVMIPFQAVLNLSLGYWGARNFGIPGLMVGMTSSFVLTGVWIAPVYVYRLARRSGSAVAKA